MSDMDPAGAEHAAISDDYTEGLIGSIAGEALRRAVMVAWMSVLLGIVIQLLLMAVRLGLGEAWPGVAIIGEFAHGVSWAMLVCIGLAVGTVAGRDRTLVMGLLGLISGPVAWGVAKGVQRTVQSATGVTPSEVDGFFYIACAIKGVEYAVLGAALGYMSMHAVTRIRSYMLLGAAVGLAAATAVVTLNVWRAGHGGAPLLPVRLAGTALNEFIFPVGCALVICMALRMKRLVGLQ
ncbi:hypothetical protein [Bosea sp. 117]|uniref:hypothetical protein n=1 Tax=Bosea sp. 117 TaxID=1125973 RepID=UPI000493C809|nr:hypothetical protein [Bosea sp. 117]